ncbi:hypothetical protein B0H17DRAFT_1145945 [Mycena rosella]|uniref:Uncharacterized protein n=1 Tax=Mycena rosella TaxID=1033263 RepID=A0AAD7G3Y8_MYCRO|nr:hypothetical protein B0H17DRAFT_1145945 [Mycena rosella]
MPELELSIPELLTAFSGPIAAAPRSVGELRLYAVYMRTLLRFSIIARSTSFAKLYGTGNPRLGSRLQAARHIGRLGSSSACCGYGTAERSDCDKDLNIGSGVTVPDAGEINRPSGNTGLGIAVQVEPKVEQTPTRACPIRPLSIKRWHHWPAHGRSEKDAYSRSATLTGDLVWAISRVKPSCTAIPILAVQMNGNDPRPPVKLVCKWTKQPAPLPIPFLPTLPSAGHSNTPVTLSLPPVSTQVPLRAPKKTQYQKIDDFICTNGFPTLGDFLMALFQHRVRGEKDHRTRRHRQAGYRGAVVAVGESRATITVKRW